MSYNKSVVSFLDILGFGNLVENSSYEEINKILDIAISNSETDKVEVEAIGRRGMHFSDTIIMTCPLLNPNSENTNPHGILYHELMAVVFLQCDLLDRCGTLIRGAVTIGDVHHDDGRIFGPAVIKGYRLESQLAVFPRVIIDPELLEAYQSDSQLWSSHHDFEADFKYTKELIRQDTDGLWFVDYLSGSVGEFDEPSDTFVFWEKHKDLIITEGGKVKNKPSLAIKYVWMAKYHNQFIDRIFSTKDTSNFPKKKEDYLISTQDMPLMFEFNS